MTTVEKAQAILGNVDPLVGIMVLDDDGRLASRREAKTNKATTDPAAIFDCMRQAEFCSAVKDVFGYVPDVPNSNLYRESKKCFAS